MSPAGLDGLPRTIKCGHQDTGGARIKDIIAEEVAHVRSPPRGRGYIALYFFGLARRTSGLPRTTRAWVPTTSRFATHKSSLIPRITEIKYSSCVDLDACTIS